jgi:ClpP class serine protease
MSEPQHEQLSALLDTIYEGFTSAVAASRGKSAAEVRRRPRGGPVWRVGMRPRHRLPV